VAAVVAAPFASVAPTASAAPVVGCASAGVRVQVTSSIDLDPSCTYTAGFDVVSSGTTLDCKGATIRSADGAGGVGILVHSPTDQPLSDVSITDCKVRGFLNSIRVTRDGFRTLAAGHEYDHETSDIVVDHVDVAGSRGVGIYIDGYVSGVTVERSRITGAGSSGIYMDGGSRENRLADNEIVGNGFRENGPDGQQASVGGTTFWFWGVGREGISVDGSSDNTITGNHLEGNSAGGIFLYKNCGEYPDRPAYFERRTPSDHNVITRNVFDGGRNGVWVGSRMAENTLPMDCTDPAYIDEPARRVVLDHAAHNQVTDNTFHEVTYGVRVEDDDTEVLGNTFTGASPADWAVIIGTPLRAAVLHRPVSGTRLLDNVSSIHGNANPYRWVPGQANTTADSNRSVSGEVGICEAPPLPRQTFIFTIALQVAKPGEPKPPTPDLTVPTLGALPACDRSTGSTTTAPVTSTTTTAAGSTPSAPGAAPVGGSASFTG
jgi:parallel beta-helix repeat protein